MSDTGGGIPASPLDKDFEDLSAVEKRGRICRKAGTNERWDTRLTKETINSVYAFLSGEFLVPSMAVHNVDHPEYMTRRKMLHKLVVEAEIGEPQDRWSVDTVDLPAKLTPGEVGQLLDEMAARGDQRSWTPEPS